MNNSVLNKDGYIYDYISNKEIKATPEELEAVQPYSEILVNDYGYAKDDIQTRPQWRVKSSPSDTKGTYPLDIAVFRNHKKTDKNLHIIIECKKNNVKEGRSQLEDYLKLSHATLGVWYNGKDAPLYLHKIIKNNGVYFEEIPNIPRKNERLEDLGKFRRKDLKPAHNLKTIFKILRSHLAGNAIGTTRDEELAKQLINIIFTKIYDERFKAPKDLVDFRAGIDESPEDVKKRIDSIFELVKTKYKEVIDIHDEISLDASSLYFVVGQLQNYCLIEAERDVIADAFETFIGYALKGPQGQFFTPRNVVKLMVDILDPKDFETIIDPACGSGGFIVESLRYVWNKIDVESKKYGWSISATNEEKVAVAITKIHGIEKDSFLSKVAKAYMAILGDGKGGIFCEDSLEEYTNWGIATQQRIKEGSFDCLLANPPFGKDIKVIGSGKLKQFDLAYKWKKEGNKYTKTHLLNKDMPPQILFIERSLQLLRDGGRMGIIIPETYFHAPRSQYVMNFMAQHNIYCLIDLPHNTFRPHNNAKCIAVFIEKNKPQQDQVLMAVAEEMGHDHQGKPIFRWDKEEHKSTKMLWDDFVNIKKEIDTGKHEKYTFFVSKDKINESQVYVPRYYWENKDKYIKEEAKKEGYKLITINQLINEGVISYFDGHGSPASENKGRGEIPYIRVKDIVNWDVYKDPTSKIPEHVYLSMISENKSLKEEDVLYVRRGSYRIGSVAMVSPYDTKVLLTREILVLRVNPNNKYGITPFYLLYALSHKITQEQAKNKILIETTLPNIADRWKELSIPIFINDSQLTKVSNSIKTAIYSKWDAINQINKLKSEFGELVT